MSRAGVNSDAEQCLGRVLPGVRGMPTMAGLSKSRPPMSYRKSDLGIPCQSKSPKVLLVNALVFAIYIIHSLVIPKLILCF
jgi:hypothetical protein